MLRGRPAARLAWLVAAVSAVLPGARARSQVVLNEVLYDPAGADAGGEFVELFNPGPSCADLAGCRLEFANGAVAPAWLTRWTGSAGDTLAAGAFFLIADRGWSADPEPAVEVSLALQNGPDAVRWLRADGTEDRLGYGAPADPALCEGAPHPGGVSGTSLARRPDGCDTDRNDVDWVIAAPPTPGSRNFREWDLALKAVRWEPPSLPAAGQTVLVGLQLVNPGLRAWTGGRLELVEPAGGILAQAERPALHPQQETEIVIAWTPEQPRRYALQLQTDLSAGEGPRLQELGIFQVGVDGPYLNEVSAAPAAGGCEWIEIGCAGPAAVELGGCRFRDEDGSWRALPDLSLAPGELCLVVQDSGVFWSWWNDLPPAAIQDDGCRPDPERVREAPGGWPSLNNTPPASREFADRIQLADSAGVVVDHLRLGDGILSVPAGRSLEREAVLPLADPRRNWGPAASALGGSPGCINGRAVTGDSAGAGGGLRLAPNPFRAAAGGNPLQHLLFELKVPSVAWRAEVFDLWGRKVRDLGGDSWGAGPRDVLWDGADDAGETLAPGAYIVLVRTFTAGGQACGGGRRLSVLGRDGDRP